MLSPYSETVAQDMKFVYEQLCEKDRRLYAGVEAEKLPRGGQAYIADLLAAHPKRFGEGNKNWHTLIGCLQQDAYDMRVAGASVF
jgi:hypothetical protein